MSEKRNMTGMDNKKCTSWNSHGDSVRRERNGERKRVDARNDNP